MWEDLTSNLATFQVSDDRFSSIFGLIASIFGRVSYFWACATLALLAPQYSWLSDRSSADNSSETPTLRRISAVYRQEAYLHAYQAIGPVSLDHLGRSYWRTSRKSPTQPRIFTRTETRNYASRISPTVTTNLSSTIRTCWSIAIPSRFATRQTTAISSHVVERPFSSPIKTWDSTTP